MKSAVAHCWPVANRRAIEFGLRTIATDELLDRLRAVEHSLRRYADDDETIAIGDDDVALVVHRWIDGDGVASQQILRCGSVRAQKHDLRSRSRHTIHHANPAVLESRREIECGEPIFGVRRSSNGDSISDRQRRTVHAHLTRLGNEAKVALSRQGGGNNDHEQGEGRRRFHFASCRRLFARGSQSACYEWARG